MVKVISTICILLLLSSYSFADTLAVPFSVTKDELRERLKEVGYKLDNSPYEKTEDSWGYIFPTQMGYEIKTYTPVTDEELPVILNVIMSQVRQDVKK